jgi:nucleoside-diphosphate-sugar epimerase
MRALIGHTGFVGGNLQPQAEFDAVYHSATIETLRGQACDLIVCAGAPAVKWVANADPDADWANLARLIDVIRSAPCRSLVLISTVDVYASPIGVDERTVPDATRTGNAYGYHRRQLELAVQATEADVTIVRLPALFGEGLKKNVIYDLLHDHQVDRIHPDGAFQYYNLDWLWADIERVRTAGVREVNLAVPPLTVREVAETCFGRAFENPLATGGPALYDMKTVHSSLWGRTDGYSHGRDEVLSSLRAFVQRQREATS